MPITHLKRLLTTLTVICVLSAQGLFAQTSSSYCNGDNLLFYNAATGAGVSGKISSTGFTASSTYTLPTGWTQIAQIDTTDTILFYNANTGAAEEGTLSQGVLKNTQVLGFAPGWTSILYAGLHDESRALPLFYNASNGGGAVGFSPTETGLGFTTGWTHFIWDGANLLVYNKNNGAGAVLIGIASPTNSNDINNLLTTKPFIPGSFSSWTNLTVIGGEIFFYNSASGAAAIGRLTPSIVDGANNFVTDKGFTFSPHWTNIVGTANNLALFYNSTTGDASVVQLFLAGPFSPTRGLQFRTVAVIPHGQLQPGYTHVVCSEDSLSATALN